MQCDELLARDEPQPEEGREPRVGRIAGRSAEHLDLSLLEHIRRVDPPLKPAVEPQPNHAPQLVAVPGEQVGQRLPVAGTRAAQQLIV